ncbi:uncharacterized protein F5147DRAFT_833142 [Suillus discolor]|uniref:N-acetyltransferase domain-containing protein n=1 Tax=Suillus discolor TaxID=1912936 RepID=A0A9P7JZK1_9AGAM|nr:uncharacterized protein F5147DRAFT_833142 [Suillus discolor]KAG2118010.1 hypothetical protein F5147DRAFT_833142 [Suillus discolor]
MPGLLSSVQVFDLSTGLSEAGWNALLSNAARANLVLPHAEKVFGRQIFTPRIDSAEQLWLTYSKPGTSEISLVLSCTEGPLDKYPLFIIPTIPIAEFTPEFLESSMMALCSALVEEPGFRKERVFSIFSVENIAEAFALTWERLTGIGRIEKPYYSAFFSVCTESTLVRQERPPRPSEDVILDPRLAVEQDAEEIAKLCREFAKTSEPFTLSKEKAGKEAELLIANKSVWVLEIKKGKEKPEIATIVAATRKSKGVATISKVYTPEKWRGKGCAERLVRHACSELLEKYKEIVLYVGVENSAKIVYDRVGFQVLRDESLLPQRWLEIGFDENKVELGHW